MITNKDKCSRAKTGKLAELEFEGHAYSYVVSCLYYPEAPSDTCNYNT